MPHRLNAYLASNHELRQFSNKAKQLAALQQHYESITPPALSRSSRVWQLHQQTLIIAANNGAVAAKLRQMSTELISLFQAMGCEITGIQIKVQVTVPPRRAKSEPRKLGKTAQDALGKLGDRLADSPLKTALERLLKR
ncbi:MAG TPA: DciA family protein [Sideroxyarcus sp.]|nr:DciA family protein [Sideroxyarcus sp.]